MFNPKIAVVVVLLGLLVYAYPWIIFKIVKWAVILIAFFLLGFVSVAKSTGYIKKSNDLSMPQYVHYIGQRAFGKKHCHPHKEFKRVLMYLVLVPYFMCINTLIALFYAAQWTLYLLVMPLVIVY